MRWFLLPSEAQLQLMGQPIARVAPPFQPRNYPSIPEREAVVEERIGHCPGEGDAVQSERPKAVSLAGDAKSGSRMKEEEGIIEAEVIDGSCEDRLLVARTADRGADIAAVRDATLERDDVIGTGSAAVEASGMNSTTAGSPEVHSSEATEKQQTSVPVSVGKTRLNQPPTFHCPPKRLMKPTIEASSWTNTYFY